MSERNDLLISITNTIKDYREGEIPEPTPEHVDRWVEQFSAETRLPILREMDNVLKITYFTFAKVTRFLRKLIIAEELVGADPLSFWRSVMFLDIQRGGNSQREMLAIFEQLLENAYDIKINDCGRKKQITKFIYLDDVIFTGNRVRQDIENWIQKNAPNEAKVYVISIASHSGGQYYAKERIKIAAKAAGKKIETIWWSISEYEDRMSDINISDVLRPTHIPDDQEVKQYIANMKHKPVLRKPGNVGKNRIFSGEDGRDVLEQEFLKAGAKIRSICANLKVYQRPLGNIVLETLGFGSLLVTFRNCPNNAPLALWVGDPWYPLFARSTNTDTANRRLMAMFSEDA
jgi:hypothetical protein